MKTKIIVFILQIVILLFSCNNIQHEDLTIIENLQLGQSKDIFFNSLDSLKIPKGVFLTEPTYKDLGNQQYNCLPLYYTEQFNLIEYSKETQQHLGLFYPTILSGTNNIFMLNILLGHTNDRDITSDYCNSNYGGEEQTFTRFRQEVNSKLISEILTLYVSKYGVPTDSIKVGDITFFQISKDKICEKEESLDNFGTIYIWETKALRIMFFTGFKSQRSSFITGYNAYTLGGTERIRASNQIFSHSFPYISYEIKPKVLKKLQLFQPKI